MNADLFKSIFNNISCKALTVKVRWIPSHIKEKRDKDPNFNVPDFMSELDIEANSWADHHAGVAAKCCQINDMNVPTNYLYHYHLTRKIQRRLVTILCSLPNRPKHIPKVSVPRDPVEALIANSQHIVYRPDPSSNIVACIRCKTKSRLGTAQVRSWLSGSCTAVGCANDRPIRMPYEHIQLANNVVHHSHNMYKYLNYYYCNRCGCRAKERVNKLARLCEPAQTAGLNFLDDIKSGKLLLSGNPLINEDPPVSEQEAIISKSIYESISYNNKDHEEQIALARWSKDFAKIAMDSQSSHVNYGESNSESLPPFPININNTDDEMGDESDMESD